MICIPPSNLCLLLIHIGRSRKKQAKNERRAARKLLLEHAEVSEDPEAKKAKTGRT
jgi:hypothetical protein